MKSQPIVVLAAVVSFLVTPAHAGEARKPNIVIILADDLGFGDLGCYGHPKFKTPHLDKMASEGIRLRHFHSPSPYCAPSRAALLTGRYPLRHGLTNNPAPDGGKQADALALSVSEVLLPQLLKAAGYATGMIGKWHLGHQEARFLPTQRGFDEYFGILYSNDMRPVRVLRGEKVVEYPVVQATLTDRYTEVALDFLVRNRNRPFFLYFAHAMPHKPLACSEGFYKKSGEGLYADVMAELDASVGKVLAKLKELGLDDNTLVIFTSDNGPWYGGSAGGLRGMKGTTWEGGYRVPCIARWPGRIPAGRTSDALGFLGDLCPTCLAAAGVASPKNVVLDGRDMSPLLSGKADTLHDVFFAHSGDKIAAVREARWKLHLIAAKDRKDVAPGKRWIDPRGPDGVTILAPFEQFQPSDYPGLRTGDATVAGSLFDLIDDPGEQRNVAAQHPDVIARLQTKYDTFRKTIPDR
jgi:uncharacterized sulfatase